MDVLVGLDAGTTATKAVTAGADAVVRDVVSVGYPLLVPAPGWAELDARRLMRAAVQALTDVVRAAHEALAGLESWSTAEIEAALRSALVEGLQPRNGMERLLIDGMAGAWVMHLRWLKRHAETDSLEAIRVERDARQRGEWQPPRLSDAEAVDRATRAPFGVGVHHGEEPEVELRTLFDPADVDVPGRGRGAREADVRDLGGAGEHVRDVRPRGRGAGARGDPGKGPAAARGRQGGGERDGDDQVHGPVRRPARRRRRPAPGRDRRRRRRTHDRPVRR